MSDKMIPVAFSSLVEWIFEEHKHHRSIFGITEDKFFIPSHGVYSRIFNDVIETPVGPAAGPHTQLAQNIICAYLTGGRFFELKTVQKLDELVLDKPCIDAEDEGYNVEWSQELRINESYEEYLKAWIILHLLKKIFIRSAGRERGFIFNMSIGYDLAGIKTAWMDKFINDLKDSSKNEQFRKYINQLNSFIKEKGTGFGIINTDDVTSYIRNISPYISNSVTLSTMHGCPPSEIEAIASYLITEKKLNTYVKLNPTLLGLDKVSSILKQLGYNYIELDPQSFDHDLKYSDAVPMLKRLKALAGTNDLQFGIKLSNTLGINNTREKLAGQQMYMSGRSLYPLTINLASQIASDFNGKINISFSGGASVENITGILSTGIYPVTLATGLLKPGGYSRLKQMAETAEKVKPFQPGEIFLPQLKKIAEEALNDFQYHKDKRDTDNLKTNTPLPLFDCFAAPCKEVCPIHQDIPEYISLIEKEQFNDAFNLITTKNPLPNITGYICDHKCQFKCTRWDYDEPVMIRELKKLAAEKGYDNYISNYKIKNKQENIKAAIIGAGPAGLSAAYFLAKAGISVTIFDKAEYAGGTVRNVIPEFRLPQAAIEKDIEFIKLHGVKFELNSKDDLSVEALNQKGYKYVFIAIGAGKSNDYRIPCAEKNLLNAVEFLWDFRQNKKIKLSKKVAIIGGGNSAMDSARASIRSKGVEKVYIIYRRTKEFMPADKEEFDAALADGVIYKELLLPVKYLNGKLVCTRMQLTSKDNKGRRNVVPIPNEYESIEIDTIISAVGESVDTDFLQMNKISFEGKEVQTSIDNVFIGGDALRGPSTVIESIADGKRAAESIISKEDINIFENSSPANDKRLSEIQKRKGIILSSTPKDLLNESTRCLGCDLLCAKCTEVCPNRANILIDAPGSSFKNKYQILHINAFCNECGNCETFCPHIGSPYKDKFTLFENETEFLESTNNGFVILDQKANRIGLRIHEYVVELTYDQILKELQYSEDPEIEGFNESLEMIKSVLNNYNFLIPAQIGE